MDEKKKRAIATVAIPVMMLAMVALAYPRTDGNAVPSVTDSVGFTNRVLVYKNGELVAWGPNTVTNHGKNHTRDALMGALATSTVANVSVLQLSTGTTAPAATDTVCEATVVSGNGLDGGAGTINWVSSHVGNFSINKTWFATGTQAGIAKVCLHNSTVTGANITFATASLSSAVNAESGDTLSVYYYIQVS